MTKFKSSIWTRITSLFPSNLPTSRDAFETYFKSILSLTGYEDTEIFRQTFASMIMHLPTTTHRKSKNYFVAALHKAMANDIAYSVIEAVREQAKARSQKDIKEASLTLATKQEDTTASLINGKTPTTANNNY